MTRWVGGGVHYDRSYFGQSTDVKPLTPVEEAKQKQAMDALAEYAFAPNAFDAWNATGNYLLAQRRGFDHFSENDDPNIHDRILACRQNVESFASPECVVAHCRLEDVWQHLHLG